MQFSTNMTADDGLDIYQLIKNEKNTDTDQFLIHFLFIFKALFIHNIA